MTHDDGSGGIWSPIPALNHSNADITLLFLSANSIEYATPVDNPIFAAHTKSTNVDNGTVYTSDEHVTVQGCIDQHEFCLPDKTSVQGLPFCTELASSASVFNAIEVLFNSSHMNSAQHNV